jgi:hypothetical protein
VSLRQYGSFPRKGSKRKEGRLLIADKIREQILKEVKERIKTMVREMLEALMR